MESTLTPKELLQELIRRRKARSGLYAYILYCMAEFQESWFAREVCAALDQFLLDVQAGLRPILILKAPPQHGKSEMVSRRLPAYIFGKFPDMRIAACSYSSELANTMAQDVRRNLASSEHRKLFKDSVVKNKFDINRMGEFTSPGGSGAYLAVGVGGGLTGRPVDIGIIDDPIKDQQEALSDTTKESHWNWYQSVFLTRLSENSGQIIMATSWAEDDLPGRIMKKFAGDPRLKVLRFPAINEENETGFNPKLPRGALVPLVKSLQFLKEMKNTLSDYWFSALYQQDPKPLGGNVFKEDFAQYWLPKDLPEKFDMVVDSWDCTFKDTDGTDYVVGTKWGKKGANAYLLERRRDRMSFTRTKAEVKGLFNTLPTAHNVLIEDKANGPAVIDSLSGEVPRLLPIEPDGSKLARAHAVSGVWESRNVFLPHKDIAPWVEEFLNEWTRFPAAANDDQVDSGTQALRKLFPLNARMVIPQAALDRARGAA